MHMLEFKKLTDFPREPCITYCAMPIHMMIGTKGFGMANGKKLVITCIMNLYLSKKVLCIGGSSRAGKNTVADG